MLELANKYSLINKIKRSILILLFVSVFPLSGYCNYTSFLPIEDSMSAARNAPDLVNGNLKPYRQAFSLGVNHSEKKGFFDFSTSDVCAFILLAGIYVVLVRKGSKARNASF